MAVQVGRRWRSLGDGYVFEIVARAPCGWQVRLDESEIMTIVDDAVLLDPRLYESTATRE